MLDTIKNAHDYLSKARNFKPRTNVTDVILLKDWSHGVGVLGYSVNGYLYDPYILINTSGLSADGSAASAENNDEMLLTITHELFHVFQTNYTTIDWDSNIPFWEATAVVLEEEAYKAFTASSKITTTQYLTDSDYFELLSTPIDKIPTSGNNGDLINFGYTLSRFIKYLLAHGQNNPNLEQLLTAYKQTGEFSSALKVGMSMNDQALGEQYREFCIENIELFLTRHKAAIAGNGIKSALQPIISMAADVSKVSFPVSDEIGRAHV